MKARTSRTAEEWDAPTPGPLLVDSRGRELHVHTDAAAGAMTIQRGPARFERPYPPHGVAEFELFLSPGEHWLALMHWSGQTEVAYDLFRYPKVTHERTFGPEHGYGDTLRFAGDGSSLVLAWSDNPHLFVPDPDEEYERPPFELPHPVVVEWGWLSHLDLRTLREHRVQLAVRLPAGWVSDDECEDEFMPVVSDASANGVQLDTPWGTHPLVRPLPARYVVDAR